MTTDPRRLALALIDPLTEGDALSDGVTLRSISTELGLRLTLETSLGAVHVELSPVDSTPRFAARTENFALGYRRGRDVGEMPSKFGESICASLAQRISSNEAAVVATLNAEAQSTESRVRELEVDRLLERRELGPNTHYSLSPYVGCTVGCRFCYAQTRLDPLRSMLRLPSAPWGSYVDARVNAAEVLAREIQRLPPAPIKFCPIVSDPYQPLEQRLRLTRQCLDVLRDAPPGWRVMVLTRSALILGDLDRIAAIPNALVGVSLPSVDETTLKHFEPRAATAAERLDVLRKFSEAGVETMAVVQPMLPGSVERLADALATHVTSVSLGTLEGEAGASELFDTDPFPPARTDTWQREQAQALREALTQRGVAVWRGELPPG